MALSRIDNIDKLFKNQPKVDISHLLESPKRRKSVAKRNLQTTTRRPCRPSVREMFPTVVDAARNFVENNGFKAHRRRAQDTGTCGSTIPQIKAHLFSTTPNLKRDRANLGML